jgi:hypothetical protein
MEPDPLLLDTLLPAGHRAHLLELENRLASRKRNKKEPVAPIVATGRAAVVYQLEALDGVVVKRFPIFDSAERRDFYARSVDAYAGLLASPIGLDVLPHSCEAIDGPAGPVLYILQLAADPATIADRLITVASESLCLTILNTVLRETLRVWHRNAIEREIHTHDSQIGLDARLSNWSIHMEGDVIQASYFDTGTPFIRRLGRDRIDPHLFPNHIPVRPGTFLSRRKPEDELDRYYDFRLALTDLLAEIAAIDAARLEPALATVNKFLQTEAEDQNEAPIDVDDVKRSVKVEKKRREESGRA